MNAPSLVSKLWKKEARIVMKNRGNVIARLDCYSRRNCRQVLEAFAANLETLNEALYSGMTIWLLTIDTCEGTGALELERIHESILARMRGKLKRLTIGVDYTNDCWNDERHCPSFLLIRLLLRDCIGDLTHLTLDIPLRMGPFIEQFLPHGPYPNLKVLKLDDDIRALKEEIFGSQIRILLSRAPNLQEIHTCGRLNLREKLMEGREGIVHVYETDAGVHMQDISKNVIPSLRLKSLKFFYTTEPELELDRFNEKAQSLLRTCCATTLESLELKELSLVLLMSYGIPLTNVKELVIALDYVELERFEPRILSTLLRFDFTYFFPNLKKVYIYRVLGIDKFLLRELSRDKIEAIIDQASDVPIEPTLPRAGNIKELFLNHNPIPKSSFQYFAHMFPAIEELDVEDRGQRIPFESAWELWPKLKLIKKSGRERYQRP